LDRHRHFFKSKIMEVFLGGWSMTIPEI